MSKNKVRNGSPRYTDEFKIEAVRQVTEHGCSDNMSRRRNCYDTAVAESFLTTLKRELVRKHVFATRAAAASKIFEYTEMFYNAKRRHNYLNYVSLNEFEKRYNGETSKKAVLTDEITVYKTGVIPTNSEYYIDFYFDRTI